MQLLIENAQQIQPDLVRRTCGGWLALAPSSLNLTMGVTAPTEAEAVERFRFSLSRWIEILKSESCPDT